MKALRLLLAGLLATWALAAAATPPGPPASLSVYSEQGQPFAFALDGRALTRPLAQQVRVGLLLPGQHWAEVSVPTPYGPALRLRTTLWLQPGFDNGYVLVMRRGGPQLRPLLPGAAPGPAYGGQYPPVGGAPGQYPAPGAYGDQGGYGNPAPPAPGYPGGSAYPGAPSSGTYPGSEAPGQPGAPAYPGGSGYPAPGGDGYTPGPGAYLPPLSPADFSGLQQALARRSFDDERLSVVKQALSQNTLRTDELVALLRTLAFDRSRIELAKFGYAHLTDPQNFYLVYDVLQFRASIREVQQALGLPQS